MDTGSDEPRCSKVGDYMGLHGFSKSLHGFKGLKVYKKVIYRVCGLSFTAVYI
jgi:hypothetical protein